VNRVCGIPEETMAAHAYLMAQDKVKGKRRKRKKV